MASADPQTESASFPDSIDTSDTSETPSFCVSSPLFSTSSETPPSYASASALPPPVWDVFISFRGKDTRNNFTSHLFRRLNDFGIRAYLDKFELKTGEVVWDALVEAIQKSKMYIVVFSEDYASSSWCLNELAEIYKCYQQEKRLVVGVYCNIEPTVVRYQSGSFKQSFTKHEARVTEMEKERQKVTIEIADEEKEVVAAEAEREKVKGWRRTLNKVAAISGLPISGERTQADIVDEILDVVLLEIKPNILSVPENPVGLDPRLDNIRKLLRSGTEEGVVKIGLYGMGGVGKSTLAKALYNQLLREGTFKRSCFLGEVREASLRADGLVHLQKKLLNEVSRSKKKFEFDYVEEGIKFISDRICSEKVLLLIDDIDDCKQYESFVGTFASGSIVIITTRDKHILEKIGVETKYIGQVKVLEEAESRILFSQHAFGIATPADNSLKVLIDQILSIADGLPLALKVFGGHLFTVSDQVGWISYIEKLKRNPDSTIQEKLVISLNALKLEDPKLEKLFLDIACFFIGRKRKEVVDILETYYPHVNPKIDTLKKRCLLDDESDTLRMHELLLDIGRDVARNNSDDEPGKHSRLWLTKDICRVLKNRKGTEAIEGIIPSNFYHQDAFEGVSFAAATSTFKRMNILRFLYIKNVDLGGSFEQIFENLTWFHWDGCHLECLPSDFCPENLVILALRSSKMKTMWKINMESQVFENLKTLDMSYSLDLIMTPDFNKLPCLEILNLEGCKSLMEVDVSIVCLVSLATLNLGGCVILRNLPDNICDLRALKSLNIGGCSSLEALPVEVGYIESLTELSAWGLATVSNIPDSIIHLTNLVHLNLSDNAFGTPSPSRTASPPTRWDVFLSFRAEDTRSSFTSHLYSALNQNGIRTFSDEPTILRGEVISDLLLQAIHESKTNIVVFSKNYASSPWCLNELVEILNCRETMHRLVIPVFYDIDPSALRNQTGRLREIFEKHEARFEMDKVNKWRRTLGEVSSYSGWHIKSRCRRPRGQPKA
ncbi:hypothetical protein AgCh_039876 [Apium graveolens]